MKLKVCGLSNPIEVETCINNEVNFCGFILNYSKSHRYIPYEKAKKLLSIDKNKVKYVGVLVEPSFIELEKFSKLNIDYYINDRLDEEVQDIIYDYFHAAKTDNLEIAQQELVDQDVEIEEIQLMRLKIMCELGI